MNTTPDGSALLSFLITLSFLLNLVVAWRAASGGGTRVTVQPQPLRVAAEPEFAGRADFLALKGDVESLAGQLTELRQELSEQSEDRIIRVNARIDELQASMALLPERIVAMLKNTGAIS